MVIQYIECKSGTMVTNYKLRLYSNNIPNYSCLIGLVAQGKISTPVDSPLGFVIVLVLCKVMDSGHHYLVSFFQFKV